MQGVNQSKRRRSIRQNSKLSGDSGRPQVITKNGSLHPFKYAAALYTATIECRAKYQDDLFTLQQELAKFPPYVSRGHGWKGRIQNRQIIGRWTQDRSKYQPHTGKKELAKVAFRALSMSLRATASRISQQIMNEGMEA